MDPEFPGDLLCDACALAKYDELAEDAKSEYETFKAMLEEKNRDNKG